MPELPEVETVRIQLWKKLMGKTIARVVVLNRKIVDDDKGFERKLKNLTFADIDRVGKLLIFSFKEKPDRFLLGHLKMTGQFFYMDKEGLVGGGHEVSAADVAKFPGRHTRVIIHFTDDSVLYFNDMRMFGYLKVTDSKGVDAARLRFGPEPTAVDFDRDWFVEAVRKRAAPIKAVLLDQAFVAGLGNIYVDEALFKAGVRPTRIAKTLTKNEAARLAITAGEVMHEAIKNGGTTFQHFSDAEGKRGNHSDFLQVFGRDDQPCPVCGTIIKKIRVAGRGTHFCPKCQR